MSILNLNISDPAMLVERATPAELLSAIREILTWDETTLKVTNRLISVWSARAIANPNDREGISEIQRLIHYTLNRATSSGSLPEEFRHRWQQASDILEARRLNLAHADPEAQLNRLHVPEILQLLLKAGSRELPQSDLVKHLEVTTGRVTQLIGPLEANGLISKRKHGRDNLLKLTETGLKFAGKLDRDNVSSSTVKPERGSSFLINKKSA